MPDIYAPFAVIFALLIVVAVRRAFYKPKSDLAALTLAYREARKLHKPSKEIGKRLVKARTEQIKQECKAS